MFISFGTRNCCQFFYIFLTNNYYLNDNLVAQMYYLAGRSGKCCQHRGSPCKIKRPILQSLLDGFRSPALYTER